MVSAASVHLGFRSEPPISSCNSTREPAHAGPRAMRNKGMCVIMKRVSASILAGSSLLLLAACASTPPGPMIPVMPGPSKSPAAFSADQAACEDYAAKEVQGHIDAANNHQVVNGVIGAALGAGIGAAVAR